MGERILDKEVSDLSHIPKQYMGKWVAVEGKSVVGAGNTPDKALEQSKKKGIKNPTLLRLRKPNESFLLNLS